MTMINAEGVKVERLDSGRVVFGTATSPYKVLTKKEERALRLLFDLEREGREAEQAQEPPPATGIFKKFHKKPDVIEAAHWDGTAERQLEIEDHLRFSGVTVSRTLGGDLLIIWPESDRVIRIPRGSYFRWASDPWNIHSIQNEEGFLAEYQPVGQARP